MNRMKRAKALLIADNTKRLPSREDGIVTLAKMKGYRYCICLLSATNHVWFSQGVPTYLES